MPDKLGRRELIKKSIQASAGALLAGSISESAGSARLHHRAQANTRPDVIVIGGGVAGLAAARRLQLGGAKVLILEGRERAGGRLWTDTSMSGLALDLGASWIQGTNGNPITSLARNFGLRTLPTDFDSQVLYDSDGRRLGDSEIARIEANYESTVRQVEKIREQMAAQRSVDVSLREGIDRALAKAGLPRRRLAELDFAVHAEVETEYAADASELSLLNWDQDEGFGGASVLFPGGYGQLVTHLAKGLDIRLSQNVTHIEYDQRRVRIRTDRETFEAPRAIVTLPLGVLKRGKVQFSPSLPERKSSAIQKLGMGVLNKIYLRFPKVFWPRGVDGLGMIAEGRRQWSTWVNFYKYTQQPVLLGFNAGAYARRIEEFSDSQQVEAAMQTLRSVFGSSIPQPNDVLCTRWNSDPFTFGSYSFIKPGATGKDYDTLAEPVGDRLFFAGEATSRTYPATVHGAFLSGEREARRVSRL